ncbi:MAG TPA: hypothetical protein VFD58_11475 [Blastocatellia bacterium]|nr:hypothetical protein [Blastocatellia bacterium]
MDKSRSAWERERPGRQAWVQGHMEFARAFSGNQASGTLALPG